MKNISRSILLLFFALVIALGMLSACTPQTATIYRTVTFDTQGAGTVKSVRVENGATFTPPEVELVREGYTFAYWALDGEEYDFSSAVNKNLQLVAVYTPVAYRIEYTLDGGALSEDAPVEYTVESEDFTLPTPTREGFLFLGWLGEGVDAPKKELTVKKGTTGDLSFTALWSDAYREVRFESTNEELSSQVVEPGEKIIAPEITRSGYTLVGWFFGEVEWDFETMTVSEDMTLSARWECIEYPITYHTDGATLDDAPESYTVETADFTIPAPTKTGYDFLGWTRAGEDTPSLTLSIAKGSHGALELTAHFSPKRFTATYETDGSTVAPVTQEYNTTLQAPISQKTGYTLLGWFLDETAWDFENDRLTEDITLVAKWQINSYTVTYETDGSAVDPVTQEYNTSLQAPLSQKNGYTLLGWFLDETAWDFENDRLNEDITLVAKWEILTYSITYQLSGGALAENAPTEYSVETETFTLPHPTKAEHIFLGWTFEGQSTPILELTVTKGSVGDLAIVANFAINAFTVTFDAKGGSAVGSIRTEGGNTIAAPDTTKKGYTLVGWRLDGALWDFASDTVTEDITLVAEWRINTYTVSFESLGDAVTEPYTGEYDTLVAAPQAPSRVGYTFDYWTHEGEQWHFDTDRIEGDMTLVAVWTPVTYTIRYELNGSTLPNATTSYTVETPDFTIGIPTKTNYDFLGWTYEGQQTPVQTVTVECGSTGDLVLVANFKLKQYTVTFDSKGGSGVAPVTQDHGTFVSAPTTERLGYTFKYWTANGISAYNFETTRLTSNIKLEAVWEIVTYTIEYDLNDGKLTGAPTSYTVESDTFTIPVPTKTNYDFLGWTYEGQQTPVQTVTVERGSTGDLVLVANFKLKQFTVTFDSKGGSAVDSALLDINSFVPRPNCTREGYTLLYWTANGISAYNFETTRLTSNIKLEAVWQINAYTITYDANGGTAVAPVRQNHGSKLTAPETERVGAEFLGWYLDETPWDFENATLSSDITLVAKWKILYCIVSFDTQGGSTLEPIRVNYGEPIGAPIASERLGYRFCGWLLQTEPFDCEATPIVESITLVADWEIVSYTVTYKLGDASIEGAPTQYTVESPAFTLPTPTLPYHAFLGWTWAGQDTPVACVTVESGTTGDLAFTACFEIIRCEVSFDTCGGIEVPTVTQNAGTTLEEPETEKLGYRFLGWYLGESPYSFNTPLTESMTLVAKWELIEYTITYKLDGGTVVGAPESYNIHSETFTLPTPTKEHYLFLGWTYAGQSTPVRTVTVESGEIGNRTFTACFRIRTHTVTFLTNGADEIPSIKVDYGSRLDAPEIQKQGYTLLGWYYGDQLWDFDADTVEGDMILSAVWNGDMHKVTFVYGNKSEVVYVSHGATPLTPADSAYYNGMKFVCWDADISSVYEDTVFVAIYTDIMSATDMIEMYGKDLLDYSKGGLLERASALYMLALQEHESPLDGPVRERILEHLRTVVMENRAPDFNLAPSWHYTMLTATIALVRDTPSVWKHVDSELEERLDVMMKAFAYMASIGTSDYNNYKTGPSMKGNYGKGWNPNYRMANIPAILYATSYFGNNDFASGSVTMNNMLKSFDEAEYNFMIGKFAEYGWNTALSYWTTEGKTCDDGKSNHGKVGADAKTMLISGGWVVCDDTPTATTIWVDGGTGVGVNNGGKDYLYGGAPLSDPVAIIEKLIAHNYSGGAVQSNHYYDADGDKVAEMVAWIADYSTSPYQGQMGMMLEFASGNRSSTSYCSHDFLLSTAILSSAKALGIYDIKVDNPALYQLVLVGNEDFLYKNEIGYQGYSTGSYGTSTSTHSEANEGSAYFALKTHWKEYMKGSEEGYFPILPY